MIKYSKSTSLKKLTMKQIREEVKKIKNQLPIDEKKVISYSKNI